MLVPCTMPVRIGSNAPTPACCSACSAAARANWANRSVPSSTFSSIQSSGTKPATLPHQARWPGSAEAHGAGPMPHAPSRARQWNSPAERPMAEMMPMPVMATSCIVLPPIAPHHNQSYGFDQPGHGAPGSQ